MEMSGSQWTGKGQGSQVPAVEAKPMMGMFKKIGQELNQREVAYQDIRHLSSQITWDAKRAVSQVIGYFQNPNSLKIAEMNLRNIQKSERSFGGLARRLYGLDAHQYSRCYSAPIQEYTEAVSLLVFFKEGRVLKYDEMEKHLTCTFQVPDENSANEEGKKEMKTVNYTILFSKNDFYMGLADIPGELVRACATGFHTKNFKYFLFSSTDLVRSLYMCLQAIYPYPRNLMQKVNTMRSSLIKLETACYHMTIEMDRFVGLMGFGILNKDAACDYYDEERDAMQRN